MATRSRRKLPMEDATIHATKAQDKTVELDVQFINPYKGRGVFAKCQFGKGDFVVEYRGDLITWDESQRRRRTYHRACAVFLYEFYWKEKLWCIDASREDGSLGRLVNDDHRHPNCKMKRVIIEGKPHLFLFALREIHQGQEITYDYGGKDWPWRKQTQETSDADVESSDCAVFSAVLETSKRPSTSTMQTQERSDADIESSDSAVFSAVLETSKRPSTSTMQTTERSDADVESSDSAVFSAVLETSKRPSTSTMQTTERSDADVESSDSAVFSAVLETSKRPSTSTMQTTERSDADVESSDSAVFSAVLETSKRPSTSTMQTQERSDADVESSDSAVFSAVLETSKRPSTSTMQTEERSDADVESSDSAVFSAVLETSKRPSTSTMQGLNKPERVRSSVGIIPSLVDYSDSDSQDPCISPAQLIESSKTRSLASDSDLILTDQESIPRLRRTKSIQLKEWIEFDSDDLFDPTSDNSGSGEEFIPKSCEDSSEDTDGSGIVSFEQKMKCPRFPKLGKILEVRDVRSLHSTSLTKTVKTGSTPARKESTSGRSCRKRGARRVSCPRTQTSPSFFTKQSEGTDTGALLEKSLSDLEGVDGLAGDLLSIPAVSKKEDGSRKYNKRQYCLYCKKDLIKMARHLERAHKDKPEVEKAVSFPKGSKERRMHMELLRNKGNFAHNVEVLNLGVGTPVPCKQPKDKSQVKHFLHCAYCQGLFLKKVLWRHMKTCKFKPSIPLKPGRTRVQALCGFTVPPPTGVKEELWKLLNNMVQDDVFHALKSDACIQEYGEHLYNRLGYDVSKHEYIRQKLRELGRLLLCSRKNTQLKTIKEHIKPANFMHVIKSVKELAGYSSEKHAYSCPSLALKIGYSLKKISLLVESRSNVQGNSTAAKEAQIFRSVYEARWNELISSASLRTLDESKWNTPQLIPFTKDVQTLHSFLDGQQQDLICKLSSDTSPQTYTQLTKVVLTQVILFNRRRAGEVSKMSVSAYTSNNVSDPQEDVNVALSDLEKRLCKHFRRIEIRGKRGRKVPVLLTPEMQQALDLLTSKRKECGILKDNLHLFARPSSLMYYRGSDTLRYFAKACGAKNPECLTSTKLRKQTATLSQVLNLNNTELDQLADYLGHDIRVHRQFYRLPEGTLQLAKISKILMAQEQGRLAEFKGKSLDDINVDPEDTVNFDSDQEGDLDNSLEHGVTTKEAETDLNTSQEVDTDVNTSQDTVTSTQGSADKRKHTIRLKGSKGRQPSKKKKWDEHEIAAVERHMMSFITSCRVPGKSECDKCINMEKTALKNRNWLAIKFYVKNRITSLKQKV